MMTNTAYEATNSDVEKLIARKGNVVTGNYYLAECGACGEMFTSERMTGGQAIADTGDYGDCYCPHCDTDDSEIIDCGAVNSAVVEAWNFQQKHIDALIAALEQAERANAAQDDHISQQADRIDVLEKRNAELGGQLARYSMSPGEADQRRCESRAVREALGFGKDADNVAPIDLRQRIAELEASKLSVKLPVYRNSPDMHTKQYYEAIGFNQGLDACAEAFRAAGGNVDGGE